MLTLAETVEVIRGMDRKSFLAECKSLRIKAQRCVARKCLVAGWFKLKCGVPVAVVPRGSSLLNWDVYRVDYPLTNCETHHLPRWVGQIAAEFDETKQESELNQFAAKSVEDIYPS